MADLQREYGSFTTFTKMGSSLTYRREIYLVKKVASSPIFLFLCFIQQLFQFFRVHGFVTLGLVYK